MTLKFNTPIFADNEGNKPFNFNLKLQDNLNYATVQEMAHSTFDISKFTKIGTPTISDDGIVSDFGGSSSGPGIKISTTLLNTDNFDFEFGFTNSIVGENRGVCKFGNITLYITSDGIFMLYQGSTYVGINVNKNTVGSFNIRIKNDVENARFNFEIYDANKNLLGSNYWVATHDNITEIRLGGGFYTAGNGTYLNLKSIKITKDNVPYFSGNIAGIDTYTIGEETVSIPYTVASNDWKIADCTYNTRIQTLKAQDYNTPYLVIDEVNQNFTDYRIPALQFN